MKTFVFETYDLMSERCADIIVSEMLNDKRVNLSITAGNTPKRMYEILEERLKAVEDLSHVHYYIFDETPILNKNNEVVRNDSYDIFLKQIMKPCKVKEEQITRMTDDNYMQYPSIIENDGGLDLMLIGMGADGHFCANMPECTQIDKEVYKVKLSNEFPWNEPYQKTLGENHSEYMYTLGLPALIKTKRVILIVNGESKAEAVKRIFNGPLDENFPVSYLRLIPNLTILMDKAAASLL